MRNYQLILTVLLFAVLTSCSSNDPVKAPSTGTTTPPVTSVDSIKKNIIVTSTYAIKATQWQTTDSILKVTGKQPSLIVPSTILLELPQTLNNTSIYPTANLCTSTEIAAKKLIGKVTVVKTDKITDKTNSSYGITYTTSKTGASLSVLPVTTDSAKCYADIQYISVVTWKYVLPEKDVLRVTNLGMLQQDINPWVSTKTTITNDIPRGTLTSIKKLCATKVTYTQSFLDPNSTILSWLYGIVVTTTRTGTIYKVTYY